MPHFPNKCRNFIDLFAGGLNVGINANADCIYANDRISYLIEFYSYIQNNNINTILQDIYDIIAQYGLSKTNTEGYNLLREEYNKKKTPLKLFVLACYSFNHQIRFNNSYKYNTPFGKNRSTYNKRIENNLIAFSEAMHKKHILLTNTCFKDFDFSMCNHDDIVYCDPPYLITTGAYNDGHRGFGDWKENDDAALLYLLDRLNNKHIRFALSNVLQHKDQTNDLLIEWSKKYHVIYLDKTYSNCSYHFKNKEAKTIEVLITNY